MRKGKDVEIGVSERERRARHLRLILRCAGPGSVTGSQSSKCRREGRPHGGYKGLSNQYPLSRTGFDKQEFMEEIKNAVNAEYREEQRCRTNSPQWLPSANQERSHSGEQPLMLQNFLAANKQEQVTGVLPTPTNRPNKSATMYMYRDDPDYFCRGNSTHQYLTATEMPGQSERLVDLALGRPTRTSLLRVRQRTKSAPGVRAVVEVKTHLHKQQYLAAKTEDRHKSVDFPQDLLPMTDNETVHQFLIGARYNRMYHRDAKCLSKFGLFVSRQHPQHCFKMKVPTEDGQASTLQRSALSAKLTESCKSFGSRTNVSELKTPKAAWSTKQDVNPLSKEGFKFNTPSANSPLADNSRNIIPATKSAPEPCGKNKPKTKLVDGKSLNGTPAKDDSSCVICNNEESSKRNHGFAPGNRFSRIRERCDATTQEPSLVGGHGTDHMMLQQYHLRIMGIKYGTPLPDLHYVPRDNLPDTDLPNLNKPKNLKTVCQNDSNTTKVTQTKDLNYESAQALANSSKISAEISQHSEDGAKGARLELIHSRDSPNGEASQTERAELLTDANNNLNLDGDTAELKCLKKSKDEVQKNEAPEDGTPRDNEAPGDGKPRDNEAPEDGKPRDNKAPEDGMPRNNEAPEDGTPRDNEAPEDGMPRDNEAAEDGTPRDNEAAEDGTPRDNEAAEDGMPRDNEAPEDGMPRDNEAPEDGMPRDNAAPEDGKPRDNEAPEDGKPRDNEAPEDGTPRDNKAPEDGKL